MITSGGLILWDENKERLSWIPLAGSLKHEAWVVLRGRGFYTNLSDTSHPHLVIVHGEAERSGPGVSALAPGHVPLGPVHGLGQRQHQGQQPAGHHCQHSHLERGGEVTRGSGVSPASGAGVRTLPGLWSSRRRIRGGDRARHNNSVLVIRSLLVFRIALEERL